MIASCLNKSVRRPGPQQLRSEHQTSIQRGILQKPVLVYFIIELPWYSEYKSDALEARSSLRVDPFNSSYSGSQPLGDQK